MKSFSGIARPFQNHEWSQWELRDIDGQAGSPNERERKQRIARSPES